jgi:neutral ceramidase
MRRRPVRLAHGVAMLLLLACHEEPVILPAPRSPAPAGPLPGGRQPAGAGGADITLPPGISLAGYGSEGKRSQGYRQRLYVRALVLEDSSGERVALVVADLPFISTVLHRWTARALLADPAVRIGADRLVLSATHTHAAPGNFLDAKTLNHEAARQPGFDPVVADTLAHRIALAVRQAVDSLAPACAAWSSTVVYGQTRNRSYGAFRRNQPLALPFPAPPPGLDPAETAVNPLLSLLRVDRAAPGGQCDRSTVPLGAYSVFAVHGTVNPGENDLLDPDLHGQVERGLERWIDTTYALPGASSRPFPPRSVHLFANGTEGDVSADWPAQSRCPLPRLRPLLRPGGPEPQPAWDWIHPDSEVVSHCIHHAREYLVAAGRALALRAIDVFRSLDGRLGPEFPIGIASTTLFLRRDAAALGICDRPRIGLSTAAGADDGYSRFYGARCLGLFPAGIEDGGQAAGAPKGCQREKKTWLNIGVSAHGLPEYGPLTALRLGDRLLLTVPGEPTTMTGVQIQRTAADSIRAARTRWAGGLLSEDSVYRHAIVLGHTNGFIQYVTTDAEYSAQEYEGGSTLYGPGEATALARALGHLAAELARTGDGSPGSTVDSLLTFPGDRQKVYPRLERPRPARPDFRFDRCADTVVATWRDVSAAKLPLADGPILRVDRVLAPGDTVATAWDDDPDLEVRVLDERRKGGAEWQLRWSRRGRPGAVRIVLLGRAADSTERRSPVCPPVTDLAPKEKK